MRLAINGQQMAATHALPELLDVLAGLGVDAVELWPANLPGGGDPEADERWETRDVAAAARLLKERGIDCACVTLGFWAAPVCFARGGAAAFTEALFGAVDAAAALGAPIVNCYSTGIPARLFTAAVKPAAAYGEDHGVVITLENEAHDDSALPQTVAKIVEGVGLAGFGTQYDPCNYYHAYVEPYPAAYEAVRPHVRYVHLKGGCHYDEARPGVHRGSTMRGSERDRIGYVPLPEAAFPVEAIVRRLKRDGYEGFVTLEPHVPADALAGFYAIEVPYLLRLLSEPG